MSDGDLFFLCYLHFASLKILTFFHSLRFLSNINKNKHYDDDGIQGRDKKFDWKVIAWKMSFGWPFITGYSLSLFSTRGIMWFSTFLFLFVSPLYEKWYHDFFLRGTWRWPETLMLLFNDAHLIATGKAIKYLFQSYLHVQYRTIERDEKHWETHDWQDEKKNFFFRFKFNSCFYPLHSEM